jgi:hypothetical protein
MAARLMGNSLGRAVLSLLWLLASVATRTRHAQSRRPRQRACPPKEIAGAPCPDRVWLVVASAHLDRARAQHALVAVLSPSRCRSPDTVVSSCSIAAAVLSLMPTYRRRRLVLPWLHLRRYRSCSPSRGAGAVGSIRCRVPSLSRRACPTGACSRRRFASSRSGRF